MRAKSRFALPGVAALDNPKCPVCGESVELEELLTHRDTHFPRGRPNPDLYPLSAEQWNKLTKMAKKGGS